jgi:hypothetical protein
MFHERIQQMMLAVKVMIDAHRFASQALAQFPGAKAGKPLFAYEIQGAFNDALS